jgi:hypothetical protein
VLFRTEQIDDVIPDRLLPSKLDAIQSSISQNHPHPPLDLGLILPQRPSARMLPRHCPQQTKIPLSP